MDFIVEDWQSQDAGQSCQLFVLWLISRQCYANMGTYQYLTHMSLQSI